MVCPINSFKAIVAVLEEHGSHRGMRRQNIVPIICMLYVIGIGHVTNVLGFAVKFNLCTTNIVFSVSRMI